MHTLFHKRCNKNGVNKEIVKNKNVAYHRNIVKNQ